MTKDELDMLKTILEVGLVLFAATSAFFAWRSANETRKATHAQLLSALLDAYAEDKMLEAMLTLRQWKQQHGNQFADQFRTLRQTNYSQVIDLDRARRRVSHHFSKICTLHKAGLCDEELVRRVATEGQVQFYRELIEPLELALNPSYDSSCFSYLGSLYDVRASLPPMANP
jgi:DNA-binding transcriptional ArsR family regulator